MKKKFSMIALVVIFGVTACSDEPATPPPPRAEAPSYVTLSPKHVRESMEKQQNLQLVDVRTQGEWDAGHIEGAIHIPLADLPSQLSKLNKLDPVFAYCASGGRSAQALELFKKNGFQKAGHMEGGIDAWRAADFPTIQSMNK